MDNLQKAIENIIVGRLILNNKVMNEVHDIIIKILDYQFEKGG